MKKPPTNIAASVHGRLLHRARAEQRPFNELLQYYAMERFLYRLSCTEFAERFVLKGGLMLQLWGGPLSRATQDIDLHRASTAPVGELVEIIQACLKVDVEDDGMQFNSRSVEGAPIRLDAHYHGVRIRFGGQLGNARIKVQVDVGFGDIITPHAQPIQYPTLLNSKAPQLLGYTPETSIAEKFEAMVTLDMANTRMKDFLDIWMLTQNRSFEGDVLSSAIRRTFEQRRTPLPTSLPTALTPAFSDASDKQSQWAAYARKIRVATKTPTLTQTTLEIGGFLMPIVEALHQNQRYRGQWHAGGPWEPIVMEPSPSTATIASTDREKRQAMTAIEVIENPIQSINSPTAVNSNLLP